MPGVEPHRVERFVLQMAEPHAQKFRTIAWTANRALPLELRRRMSSAAANTSFSLIGPVIVVAQHIARDAHRLSPISAGLRRGVGERRPRARSQ